MDEAKPFNIPKRVVWKAFKRVKANRGAAGVDKQSIAEFEADLSNNLYKLWNRMCSGSYFPPPVRRVEIPKANGGTRPLGVPTVADRIAQEGRPTRQSVSPLRLSTESRRRSNSVAAGPQEQKITLKEPGIRRMSDEARSWARERFSESHSSAEAPQ